ncbi:uncharacterized protein EV420DRAFT_1644299 [Desarmillaria tabescens]|uniref:Uncharacterized protein n=1 Tax=Armillaria tabescens TaxID=1929756 RepID=A0AA39N4I7_ARMTA|nr:uncharacterized protein EV420DRAFT_1644299 [Desarmillaria tabescens]KAK0457144.1 hypothetical protein EV420DRAFT_1644299 [Desarmillaria tabescens]
MTLTSSHVRRQLSRSLSDASQNTISEIEYRNNVELKKPVVTPPGGAMPLLPGLDGRSSPRSPASSTFKDAHPIAICLDDLPFDDEDQSPATSWYEDPHLVSIVCLCEDEGEIVWVKDVDVWTTSDDNFRHIRCAVDTIIDAKPIEPSSHASSIVSGGVRKTNGTAHTTNGDRANSAPIKASPTHSTHNSTSTSSKQADTTECIPFIGIYLSQLTEYSHQPDLIDPGTSPTTPASIDLVTYSYDTLSHPEVFSALQPLPAGIQMEPLINVHKQQMRAKVVVVVVLPAPGPNKERPGPQP